MKKGEYYEIIRKERFNAIGLIEKEDYVVRHHYLCFFGLIETWKMMTTGSGDFKATLRFTHVKDAEEFVENILIKKKPREEWVWTPIKEIR